MPDPKDGLSPFAHVVGRFATVSDGPSPRGAQKVSELAYLGRAEFVRFQFFHSFSRSGLRIERQLVVVPNFRYKEVVMFCRHAVTPLLVTVLACSIGCGGPGQSQVKKAEPPAKVENPVKET